MAVNTSIPRSVAQRFATTSRADLPDSGLASHHQRSAAVTAAVDQIAASPSVRLGPGLPKPRPAAK
jgi:hypothetical protein